jgi:ribonuclease HI
VEGEAIARLRAMEDACARGFYHVQFESDSQLFVDTIRLKQRGHSEFSLIVANNIHIIVVVCKL